VASLTLQNIGKNFGRVQVLSGINLQVADGEFCVLLGPSGCGKSTLLQIVAGLILQDEGSVLMNGKSVDRLSPRDRDVAMVFQSYALYPHMTVAENLGFGLRMRGTPKALIRERVIETAELLGLEHLLDRKPRELSGGQRQRTAMGRALVRRPKLFLLDEPLSNLDARLRVSVRLELKMLHQKIKGTILYVTHDQVEAMTLGDKVAVMREGRFHQIDRPEAIYNRPADTFVAAFIGSPPMNLFPGRLIRKSGRLFFTNDDLALEVPAALPVAEGQPVEAGIRPEDIQLGPVQETSFPARVAVISNVGAEKYLLLKTGSTELTVRAAKNLSFLPDEKVNLTIDPQKLHVFVDGQRINSAE